MSNERCPTNGGREVGKWICCPGGVPIEDAESSTGWSCWWCGYECDPPEDIWDEPIPAAEAMEDAVKLMDEVVTPDLQTQVEDLTRKLKRTQEAHNTLVHATEDALDSICSWAEKLERRIGELERQVSNLKWSTI